MTREEMPFPATVAKSERLQTMLKNPEFRGAWDGFADALDEATDLIKQGVQPTGQELRKAAQRVLEIGVELPQQSKAP